MFFGHGGGTEYGPAVGDRVGQARALALDDQGRILVGGGSGAAMLLLRYLPNGTLDASFGSHGAVR